MVSFSWRILVALIFITSEIGFSQKLILKEEVIGFSQLKKPIKLIRIFEENKFPNKNKILLQSGLHGNEKIPVEFLKQKLKEILNHEGSFYQLINEKNVELNFLMIANPDGYETDSRYNANQINLNRNFSILWGLSREPNGKFPLSEPETQTITKLLDRKEKFIAAFDLHGYLDWVVVPSQLTNEKNEKYENWISLVKKIKDNTLDKNYKIKTPLTLGDGGAFEDWTFWKANTNSLCLELKNTDEKDFKQYDQFLSQLMYELVGR